MPWVHQQVHVFFADLVVLVTSGLALDEQDIHRAGSQPQPD